jgi:hypothetical protein
MHVGRIQEQQVENYCEDIWQGHGLQWFAQCLRAADTDADGWRNCPDSQTALVSPVPEDFELLDHDGNSVPAGGTLLVIALERSGLPNSPMSFEWNFGSDASGSQMFTCAPFSGAGDADCFNTSDVVAADGAMATELDVPATAAPGVGHVTVTQDAMSTTEQITVTGPAASIAVENATSRTELLSGSTECDYPTSLEGLQTLPEAVVNDPRRNAFIVRVFDASGQQVVDRVTWYNPFAGSGAAIFAERSTVTMDLGANGVGAVQLVCGVMPGQDTSTAWAGVPVSPPFLYQNVTVTVVDPPSPTATSTPTPTDTPTATASPTPTFTTTPEPTQTTPRCRADVNGDGTVTFKDLIAVIRGLARQDLRADVNSDGRVTVKDVKLVLRALLRGGC